jgi:protein TonB
MPFLWIVFAASAAALAGQGAASEPPSVSNSSNSLGLPTVQLGNSRPATPIGNPGEWVTTRDYPSSELTRRVAGTTAFRLAVDSEGAVADCTVTASSGSPVLDATACALIKVRARFTPATDFNGKNIGGFYANRVRWVMPPIQYQPMPVGKWDVTTTVHVGETGLIESCDFASVGNEIENAAKGFTPCSPYVAGRFMRAHKDSAGKPVRYHVIFHTTTEVVSD